MRAAGLPPGFALRHYETIDSTNTEAARLAAAGERGPLMIRADVQTAGRGRLGRNWQSDDGNLFTTLLMPVAADVATVPQLSFVVGLAVHDTVTALAPRATVGLKWPNDCLVGGAKIAGILCEVVLQSPLMVALGCGINVGHAPEGLPYAATFLRAHAPHVTLDGVFTTYAAQLQHWLSVWQWGLGFAAIAAGWRERAIGLGEQVQVTVAGRALAGTLAGLAEDGALLLRDRAGQNHHIHAGDVLITPAQHTGEPA